MMFNELKYNNLRPAVYADSNSYAQLFRFYQKQMRKKSHGWNQALKMRNLIKNQNHLTSKIPQSQLKNQQLSS